MRTPAQDIVARYVAANPGQPAIDAARAAGPNGSLRYGYRTVHRAIEAGRVAYVRDARGRMILYPVA